MANDYDIAQVVLDICTKGFADEGFARIRLGSIGGLALDLNLPRGRANHHVSVVANIARPYGDRQKNALKVLEERYAVALADKSSLLFKYINSDFTKTDPIDVLWSRFEGDARARGTPLEVSGLGRLADGVLGQKDYVSSMRCLPIKLRDSRSANFIKTR